MDANLTGLSPQVLKGYGKLDEATKRNVYLEFLSKKKDRDKAFGLSFLAGAHMPYLNQVGKFILFLLTLGGYGIWYLIEIVTSKSAADRYNTKLLQSLIAPWIKKVEEEERLIAEEERRSRFYELQLAKLRLDFKADNLRTPTEEEEEKLKGFAQIALEIDYPREMEERREKLLAIQDQLRVEKKAEQREQIELSIKLVMGKCPRCYKPVSRIATKCPHCTADI